MNIYNAIDREVAPLRERIEKLEAATPRPVHLAHNDPSRPAHERVRLAEERAARAEAEAARLRVVLNKVADFVDRLKRP